MCEAAHVGHSNCITCIGPLPVGVVEGAIHPVPWLGPPRKSHPTLEPRCTHTHLLLDSHCDRCCSCWVPSWWSYIWFPSVMPAPPTQKEWTKRPNEVPVSLWVRCLWTCSFPTGGRTCRGFLCLAFVLLMPYHLVLLYLETKFWDRRLWPP